ncbi:MAG: hypothetical protein QOJ80_7203 [Mycobacterium sp.]|jgi:hypothetical protein|nr:hypothetical protein [Mycobacterium sp.]
MSVAATVSYAYDQIDEARTVLKVVSKWPGSKNPPRRQPHPVRDRPRAESIDEEQP